MDITPVWNKSSREHKTSGSSPIDVRKAADSAVKKLNWNEAYFVDADHVNSNIIDDFLEPCDLFTIDVADYIGKEASKDEVNNFIGVYSKYIGELNISGIGNPFNVSESLIKQIASKYLQAVNEASKLYEIIKAKKGNEEYIIEVSMDETETPQSPTELFFILAALAIKSVPVNTISPKFSGRFNKGVNYVGDVIQFEKEFEEDVLVLRYAILPLLAISVLFALV